MRQHRHPLGAVQPDERAADTVQQRVAAGQHVHVARRRRPAACAARATSATATTAWPGNAVVEQIELASRAVNRLRPGVIRPAVPAPSPAIPSAPMPMTMITGALCSSRERSSRHPPPHPLRQQPHRDEQRPQRPRNPHGPTALGQCPRGGGGNLRRRARHGRRFHALGHPPDHESGPHEQQRALPSRAARRPGRCRTRPAPPSPSRRRSWHVAPAPPPPTRTRRSRPTPPTSWCRPTRSAGLPGQRNRCAAPPPRARDPPRRGPGRRAPRTPAPPCRSARGRPRSRPPAERARPGRRRRTRGRLPWPLRPSECGDLLGEPVGTAGGQHHGGAGASSRASSMPISLRPPKITTGPPLVSSTAAIISCASLGCRWRTQRPGSPTTHWRS